MMFERFAKDLSESLFNSIYDEMFKLAEAQQKSIYAATKSAKKKTGYYVGECQTMLSDFCKNKVSLGDALNYLQTQKAYAQ